jgi:hypothetical protein
LVGALRSGFSYAIRVHDAATGQLQWQDRPTVAPGFNELFLAVDLNDTAVDAAGAAWQDVGNSELLIRAFDVRDGTPIWDDRSHPSAQTAAVDLQLGKSRLFVAGYTFDSVTSSDFVIRGYDIRFDLTDSN